MSNSIKIIDLFAGPGGLGEGFSAFKTSNGNHPFSIAMSVEKEASAHMTLQLRAFYRKFREEKIPDEYYEYVKDPAVCSRDELFSLYSEQSNEAISETLDIPRALGTKDDDHIYSRLLGLKKSHKGPLVVIGGPPCQAYSLSGRSRNAGIKGYLAEKDHRHFLYKEYLKVLATIEPDVFIMENVKGILSSRISNEFIFPSIVNDLKTPYTILNKTRGKKYHIFALSRKPDDYNNLREPVYNDLSAYTVRAEDYGVPQTRHRIILLGISVDLDDEPDTLRREHCCPSIDTVISGMPHLRSGLSKAKDNYEEWVKTISFVGNNINSRTNSREQIRLINNALIEASKNTERGGRFVSSYNIGVKQGYKGPLKDWYHDPMLKGFLNHETRGHIKDDLARYLWSSTYAQLNSDRPRPSPKASEFPGFLAPNHKNWASGKFADRFRVQVQGSPATTITSHISKDGHYFIHYDPSQCRSLTVREVARIQTFPDNYFFEGNRTQQYVQVGNAVPPYLAKQIANIVFSVLNKK